MATALDRLADLAPERVRPLKDGVYTKLSTARPGETLPIPGLDGARIDVAAFVA